MITPSHTTPVFTTLPTGELVLAGRDGWPMIYATPSSARRRQLSLMTSGISVELLRRGRSIFLRKVEEFFT